MLERHRSNLWKLVVLTLGLVVLAACGGQDGAKPSEPVGAPTAASAPSQQTEMPSPTMVAKPTAAPSPTMAAKPTEAPKPMATPRPAPTAEPTPVKPTEATKAEAPTGQAGIDLLLGAMRAQLAQKAFRMNMTTEDGGKTTTMIMEHVAPSSFHSKTAGTEFIVVEGATYIKEADGKWQKTPMDMSGMVSQILSPEVVEDLAKHITVEKMKFLGPDLIDGKPMWVYQYETAMDLGGTKVDSAAKVWLGVLDKLPYRQESESDSFVNKGSKTKSTIVYEYDPGIKIEAPIQ